MAHTEAVRPSLTALLAARAVAMALDPSTEPARAAAVLARLAGGNLEALDKAARRVEGRHPRPSDDVARAALDLLHMARAASPPEPTGIEPDVPA